ncbi:MAG: glycosyltransferase family 2 protein [Dictyoglomus sp.]|nr:glycosyltransferase family 2 protein [Dictyoglomus sp.]MCX7942380.1 glycosyltransferase family 2 protein [Dictyoglomaceae bacterium]MDW8188540.1 glycosyltransferase [Dictyoglomus sp.]
MKVLTLWDYLFVISMGLVWLVLLYHIILTYFGYRYFLKSFSSEEEKEELPWYPKISVLIPAHNEEKVIGNTIDAIARSLYPKDKLEIIVINDSSQDKTGDILREKQRIYNNLKVLEIKPPLGAKGKSNALNHGLKISTGEYIAVYDADNTPERRAILNLVRFIISDPSLGAVVGKFRTRNKDKNILTKFINIETLSFQWLVQAARNYFLGLTTIPGTNFIIRKDLLEKIGGWNVHALTEDTELTIRIYQEGYKIKWVPSAITWEQEPEKLKVWIKQRTRWARGNISVISTYLKNIFFLKSKIAFDLIYFTYIYLVAFSSILISDLIFILGLLGIIKLNVGGPLLIIWILAYILFITETFISLSLEKGEGTLENLLLIALMYFTYCQLWLYVVLRAFYLAFRDRLTGKTMRWYKTERSVS